MAFNDNTMQFLTGLTTGFARTLEESRRESEQNQLRILQFLHQQGTHDIQPIDENTIDKPTGFDAFFNKGSLKTKEGTPAFKIGNNYFAAKPIVMRTPEQLLGAIGSESQQQPSQDVSQTTLYAPGQAPSIFGTRPAAEEALPPPMSTRSAAGTEVTGKTPGYLTGFTKLPQQMQETIAGYIEKYASKYGVPIHEAYAIPAIESSFDQTIQGKMGERGLMQLMPRTAAMLKVDPNNLEQNIEGGLRYYGQLRAKFKDPLLAVAAYNAGEGAVTAAGNKVPMNGKTPGHVQRFTQAAEMFQRTFAGAGQSQTPGPTEDTRVAGPGAPMQAPQDTQPALPELPPLPSAPNQRQFITNYVRRNLSPQGVPGTPAGATAFAGLLDKATAQYKAERDDVRTDRNRELKEVQDPRLKKMLQGVETYAQYEHYLQVKQSLPPIDPVKEALDFLAPYGERIPTAAARQAWSVLQQWGVKPEDASKVLEIAGYTDQKKLKEKGQEQQQHLNIEAQNFPTKLAQEQQLTEIKQKEREREHAWQKQYDAELKQNAREDSDVPAEKRARYVDGETLVPIAESLTWKELHDREKAGSVIAMSPENQTLVKTAKTVKGMAQDIRDQVEVVFGKDGPLEMLSQEKGIAGRYQGKFAKMVLDKMNDPAVRVLDQRLREWGTLETRVIEGLGARPAAQLLAPAMAVKPSLGEPAKGGLLSIIKGGDSGRLPDTKESILAQVTGAEKLIDRNLMSVVGRIPKMPTMPKEPAKTPTPTAPAVPPAVSAYEKKIRELTAPGTAP